MWENIYKKVSLCLRISDLDAYFLEDYDNKYLVFALTENNIKEVLGPYKKLWSKIKKQIKAIRSDKSIKYSNDFIKIRADSNDDLTLNKILYIHVLDIIVEPDFQIKNEYYPPIHIEECEYECE